MGVVDLFKLNGKVAIVTGASRGLGYAMALALAEAGADVAGVARSDMSRLVTAIEKRGRRCEPIRADLAKREDIDGIVPSVVERLGSLDILINNAGMVRRAAFTDYAEKDWDEIMHVHLKSSFLLSQAAARIFIEQGRGGKIINTASMLSYQGGIRVPPYTAAKHALLGLTRLMACELAEHNIQVNGIAPGYMKTGATEELQKDPVRSVEILNRIPHGRWGTPEDLMGTVVFLASEASAYVNGFTIAVDGGWLAR